MTSLFWRDDAACRDADPRIFFPVYGSGRSTKATAEAKATCATCLVRIACRDFALEIGDDNGVWGGLSIHERRTARARRSANPSLSWDEVVPAPRPPLDEYFTSRIKVDDDGHTRWIYNGTSLFVDGQRRTPGQVAFLLGHGREPESRIHAECRVHGCITSGHLIDDRIRRERQAIQDDIAA
ncbi:WhiB family transcriptional regulator [Streptomyces sp. NPDC060198]|uniref:WhiB family transcriptional regulator n=1 Tax=Streptomyces sp. NPDC060198 TaxID=3347070 RepID=UPI003647D659